MNKPHPFPQPMPSESSLSMINPWLLWFNYNFNIPSSRAWCIECTLTYVIIIIIIVVVIILFGIMSNIDL